MQYIHVMLRCLEENRIVREYINKIYSRKLQAINKCNGLITISLTAVLALVNIYTAQATNLPDPYMTQPTYVVTDTIPITNNTGDFINDPNKNPFDITPKNVKQTVEFDSKSGKYILTEKIGDEYYRMPTYMTFEEYMEWRKEQDQKEYFAKLAGVSVGKNDGNELTDPMAGIDVANSLVDRLFGGTEVNIQPQGQVDVTLQSRADKTTIGRDPERALPNTNQNRGAWRFNPIDPNVAIRVSVDGKIGTKMNLGFNYDTQSTFDFDRKIKLEYDTEAFGEDDIIKKIEAGNVSLPLRSSLIQGAQSLFGIKTELQFGHLRLTAIASQQQSEQKTITVENGAAIQEFELAPDDFDENRHFFLSHFHRDNFELALENLPQINSAFRIADIEIWVSDNRPRTNNIENTTLIAALADIAEANESEFNTNDPLYLQNISPRTAISQQYKVNILDLNGTGTMDTLPDNSNNRIGDIIVQNSDAQDEDEVQNALRRIGMGAGEFSVFQGRKLNSSEFSVNEQLGFISLNIRLRPDQNLAVAYNYYYSNSCLDGGNPGENEQPTFQVGQLAVNNTQYGTVAPLVAEGVIDTTEQEPSKVLFTKMLKGPLQPTDKPIYDLMMKNVYPLRAASLDPKEFSFDIFFEDDRDGTFKKFLPEPKLRTVPLLNLFNLDRLNKANDPQSDGVFDFVPGVTIIPSSGTVVFPVLEPFGNDLIELVRRQLEKQGEDAATIAAVTKRVEEQYAYRQLYDTSVTQARQNLERNKFRMMGFVKSSSSGDIPLGPFVPEGSVRVRAGGVELIEGADYEIDYSLGRLRIINDSYLQQGTPISVSFEDQTVFSLQQKNMMGLRADYNINKKAAIGATMLRLTERPFTQKVNIGNDPISNAIYGMDYSYSSDAPGLTKIVDKLPFYSTNAPSSINFYAEAAYLRPGYSSAINVDDPNNEDEQLPVVSIDDFEGAINGLQLGGFNTSAWRLASTPTGLFQEADLSGDLAYGANRARLTWYSIDQQARGNEADGTNAYSRFVNVQDIFDRETQVGQGQIVTFDLNYFPQERGPYNFDRIGGRGTSAGIDVAASQQENKIILKEPESRWAGIMRSFQNTDFEAANYEFIEFWMLNPFMDRPDGVQHIMDEEGNIVIDLGTVSEDILKDGSQIFENGLPNDENALTGFRSTPWGRTSSVTPVVNAFDLSNAAAQDVGYDGLNDSLERVHYEEWIDSMNMLNLPTIVQDPSADNFRDISEFDDPNESILVKSKFLSNPEGNAPLSDTNNTGTTGSGVFRGSRFPDSEDMNNNRSLDGAVGESYYRYVIPVKFTESNEIGSQGEIDLTTAGAQKYITDVKEFTPGNTSGTSTRPLEKWYRVRVPINIPDEQTDINGFRSIQFMRMFVTGFKTPKTMRLAEFQILRNLWRKNSDCSAPDATDPEFTVDEVGLQENGSKLPFGYIKPKGILEERLQSTFANLLQDEKSMSIIFDDLAEGCEVGINKLADLDLTLYKRLQLFVHGEIDSTATDFVEDGDLTAYIKLGKDLVDHYYEYEIPIKLSREDAAGAQNADNIWPIENLIDLPLDHFLKAKEERIRTASTRDTFSISTDNIAIGGDGKGRISVKGTPSLARIKVVEIGVRNSEGGVFFIDGEVWMNELRLLGLNQQGALAGEARLQINLADLGDINATASYSGIGWGALDQRLQERNRRELVNYDIATSLQLGKFLPENWGISIPFYAQYSSSTANLQFEPYEGDLTPTRKKDALEESKAVISPTKLDSIDREIADIDDRSKEQTKITTFNFTNVKKTSTGKPKPWSPSNVSVSYSYNKITSTDPIIAKDETVEHNTAIDYNYSRKAGFIQPFKSIKSKHLKIIKEINFNPFPNSFTFGTNINRTVNTRKFRLPNDPGDPEFLFDDKRFFWNRDYGLNWDFTKSLKFNFKAQASSVVDELRQVGIATSSADREWQDENGNPVDFGGNNNPDDNDIVKDSVSDYRFNNFKDFGRTKNYSHNFGLTYNLPIRHLPYMDWVTSKADYKATYNWDAGSLLVIDKGANLVSEEDDIRLGNTISNTSSASFNATLSFDKLYSKSKYLKTIDKGKKKSRRSSRSKTSSRSKKKTESKDKKDKKVKKKDTGPSTLERVLLRPLLALRNIKITYRENRSTMLPGYMVGARNGDDDAHGLIQAFSKPGLNFISGLQPELRVLDGADNFLQQNSGDFNESSKFNSQFIQTLRQTADVKIALEPIRDLDIDVDFKKSYTENYTDQFKASKLDGTFTQGFGLETGSYNFTHVGGINTLFTDNVELFNRFVTERQNVSLQLYRRLNGVNNNINVQVNGFEGYYEGFGPENSDVSIPAFLKVYTGRNYDVNIDNQLLTDVSKRTFIPAPNWTVKYDGLSKLALFKDLISSFSIRHAYIGTTTIGSFTSNILFGGRERNELFTSSNGNYSSEYNLPGLRVVDQFSPLIGFSLKLKNEMTFEGGFNKARSLNLTQLNLVESLNSEFTFGFGYTLKNFGGNKKKKGKRRGKKEQEDEKSDENDPLTGRKKRRGKVASTRGKTLTMNLDFSLNNNSELRYDLAQNTDPVIFRGTTNFVINPSVDYDVNKNLTMRYFINVNSSKSAVGNSTNRLDIRAGVTAQLKIN